jgi:hypothetical protein
MAGEKPYEEKLSEKVTGRIHRDGKVEIVVKLPWPLGSTSLTIERDEIPQASKFLAKADRYRKSLLQKPARRG